MNVIQSLIATGTITVAFSTLSANVSLSYLPIALAETVNPALVTVGSSQLMAKLG
uniref:Uncharacterized protein n=1 Tax=Cyanothece sp. (strain PCC 7425 / ATCC 29141) TaxID=395961 RepID=B8HZ39_CYAP4